MDDNISELPVCRLTTIAREICETIPPVRQARVIKNLLLEATIDDNLVFHLPLVQLWNVQRHLDEYDKEQIRESLETEIARCMACSPITHKDQTQIYPVLKNTAFTQDPGNKAFPFNKRTLFTHYVGDLWLCYIAHRQDTSFYLDKDALNTINLPEQWLHPTALTNFIRDQKNTVNLHNIEDNVWGLTNFVFNGYDASILLMPDIWTHVKNKLTTNIVAAVPCYDRVLFCNGRSQKALDSLVKNLHQTYNTARIPLSTQLFTRQDDHWLTYE